MFVWKCVHTIFITQNYEMKIKTNSFFPPIPSNTYIKL